MARTNAKSFKEKALKRPDVRKAYDELEPAHVLRRQLVALRHSAGLTQEQIAERLNTSKSNISRLESVNSSMSPKFSPIVDYAEAVGYEVKVDFVPKKKKQEHNDNLQ